MTMTSERPDALSGEFPEPPPCPLWCEIDHNTDFKTLVTWTRHHEARRATDVPGACVVIWVSSVDRYYGKAWEKRDKTTLTLEPAPGLYVRASEPEDVNALVVLASLISPEVAESVQAAALLVCTPEVAPAVAPPSSPEVTPTGEDQ
jgi:hypothetical protein